MKMIVVLAAFLILIALDAVKVWRERRKADEGSWED